MKELYFLGLILLAIVQPIQIIRAQSAYEMPKESNSLFTYRYDQQNFTSNVRMNEVAPRAFKYFLKTYPNAINQTWIMTTDGYTAFFHNKGRTIKLYFNTKGWFEYTEQTYKENDLNQDLKTLINTRFPGWRIETITEINDASQFLYEA